MADDFLIRDAVEADIDRLAGVRANCHDMHTSEVRENGETEQCSLAA